MTETIFTVVAELRGEGPCMGLWEVDISVAVDGPVISRGEVGCQCRRNFGCGQGRTEVLFSSGMKSVLGVISDIS
jgi:phosphoribosyl-dephospho-CoA transferase